ncbi:MAG: RNA polymerase sigma factor [Gemmatimonadota bacterium]|nr:RNA polymerase sigma factor [Gemmatimonadota bacterium]
MKAETGGADGERGLDDLARAAGAGDSEAFERLVRRVYARIHRWALVRIGDPDDADDVVQSVLLRLHGNLESWEERSRFTTWLYRITSNEASTWRRRATRRARWLVRDAKAYERAAERMVGPARDEERSRMVEMVTVYFRDLPPRQREVFDLVDFQGYAPGEVAEMLDMNPNTVRANLFKARRALRERMTGAS